MKAAYCCAQPKSGIVAMQALIYLYGHIRNFFVVEALDGEIVACCALAPVWEDLGEICSLAVTICVRPGARMAAARPVSAANCI